MHEFSFYIANQIRIYSFKENRSIEQIGKRLFLFNGVIHGDNYVGNDY